MRRPLLGLGAAIALFVVGRWVALALVPETTRIRWRLESMCDGFNETRLSPCLSGIAPGWRHASDGLDRERLTDALRSLFFHERDPQSGRFPLRAEIEPDTLEITLDEQDEARAGARLVGRFLVLEGGAWSSAWRARLELELARDAERGWQVARSAHVDLESDGRFPGTR